ncbi:MAG: ABC transporter ATP-binding protein [Bacillota bacterium]
MLEIKNLTIKYPTSQGLLTVLDDINLRVQPGEKLGIIGESGSGKTSLALALMGLSPGKVEGSINYHGKELLPQSSEEWEKLRGETFSMVMQHSGEMLTPVIPLLKQVAEAYLKKHPQSKAEAHRQAAHYLEKVGLPEHFHQRLPYTLSGGEVQRALLAMALISDPELLILDEPVSSLDAISREEILTLLDKLTFNRTVLVISHDLSSVARLAGKTSVLYCGTLLESGPTGHLFQEPLHPYSRALVRAYPTIGGVKELQGIRGEFPLLSERPGGCPFHPRCTQSIEICSREKPVPRHKKDNRVLSCHRGGVVELLRGETISRRYLLEKGNGANKKSAYLEAVQKVDISLDEGEVYALVGESGSGKTTLGRVLAGVDRPDAGRIFFQNQEIHSLPAKDYKKTRRDLQMLFQNSGEALSHRLNVFDLVEEPLIIQGVDNGDERLNAVYNALKSARLPLHEHFLQEYPHHLSGGELQRVAIARALVLEPRVLVADEPSASLDASIQAKIIKLLLHLQNEKGFALFLITHDLALAARAGDRIGVMYSGHLVEEGPSAIMIQRPLHPYTRQLLQAAPSLEQEVKETRGGQAPKSTGEPEVNRGCPYAKACPEAEKRCLQEMPALKRTDHRKIACHLQ